MGITGVGNAANSQLLQLEQSKLANDGKIDATEAKDLGAKVASQPELAKQMLASDNFESPKARAAFATAAHISNAAPANAVVGKMVGGASIVKQLGDPKGYENPIQAAAAARMTGVKDAGVVKQGDRYIAVQLSKSAPGPQKTDASLSPAIGLLPRDDKAIAQARTDLANARAEKPQDAAKINGLQQELASKTFGFPPESFKIISRDEDRAPTTIGSNGMPQGINIQNQMYEKSSNLGTHGSVGHAGDDFDPKVATGISIDAGDLEGRTRYKDDKIDGKYVHQRIDEPADTDKAIGVLEHEATHLEDHEEAKGLIKKWGGDYSKNPGGFQGWLTAQEKAGKISHAEASRVGKTIGKLGGDTELHAHMSVAVDAIRNGAPDVAKEQMKDYAVAYPKGEASNPQFMHVLSEASKAYKTMTKDQQAQYRDALKEAGGIFKNFDPAKGTYNKRPIVDN